MEDKKQEKINEQEKNQKQERNQEQKQGVLELIEDSLGGVSGGVRLEGTNLDAYNHWNENEGELNSKWQQKSKTWRIF